MFLNHLFLNWRRQKLLKNNNLSKSLLQYLSQPLIDRKCLVDDVEFLVLDFETTGLNADEDKIISIGYTVIKNLHMVPSSSTHILVNPEKKLTEKNVSIHQLTDSELERGLSLSDAMEKLFLAMENRVVVVHFEKIEKSFINTACNQLFQINSLPMIMFDTLEIEHKKMQRMHQAVNPKELRLFSLRDKYNLPRYKAHNAMQDAISTAELFLAQLSYISENRSPKLEELI